MSVCVCVLGEGVGGGEKERGVTVTIAMKKNHKVYSIRCNKLKPNL